jgi:hypothetical protein
MTFPDYMSTDAIDLIDKLLQLKPENRLGCGSQGAPNDI